MKALTTIMFLGIAVLSSMAQSDNNYRFPYESGMLHYDFTGSTKGQRDVYFIDFGNRMSIHSDLLHSSSFFGIDSENPERSSEYLYEGSYYYFDLMENKGYILDRPLHVHNKYLGAKEELSSLEIWIEEAGAIYQGDGKLLDKNCSIWTLKSKEIWVWNDLLMKVKSNMLNKRYVMELTSMEFDIEIPEEKLRFPAEISVPLKKEE